MNRIYISLCLCFACLASSCSYLDTNLVDQANLDDVFSQRETVRSYLAHIYNYIPLEEDPVSGSGYVVARSDQARFSWYTKGKYELFRSGNYSASSMDGNAGAYSDYWNDYYNGIRQCTIFIQHIDLDVNDTPQIREYMRSEARFLRAYLYYFLLRQYGPVVLLGDGLYDDGEDLMTLDRNTVQECVEWIVSELDKATDALPLTLGDTSESVERWQGRVTKGAALALKARVLMMAASPLFNGCALYKGVMKNYDGEYLFPQEADLNKWQQAADACKKVIDLGLYNLCRSEETGDAFKDGAASYQKVFFDSWNEETIWGWWRRTDNEYSAASYSSLGSGGLIVAMQVPKNFGKYAYSGICPSLKLVDSYAMWETGRYPVKGYEKDAHGQDYSRPVIDPVSGYKPEGWTDNYKQPVDASWAPAFKAHNSCVGREPRFYACIVPSGFYWPNANNADKDAIGSDEYEVRKGGRFSVYDSAESSSRYSLNSIQHPRSGYAWRRNYKADTSLETESDYTSMKSVYPEFRLAEVYLSYAEACNEKPDRDEATAIEYLDKVRSRVGLCSIKTAYPEVIGNQALLRTLIRRERQVEFAMEPLSYYDACRWMTAKDEYPAGCWSLKCSASTYEESYERVDDEIALSALVFTDRDYFYPISSAWLKQMPGMTQNYGF